MHKIEGKPQRACGKPNSLRREACGKAHGRSGAWSMEHGTWSMEHGALSMEHGLFSPQALPYLQFHVIPENLCNFEKKNSSIMRLLILVFLFVLPAAFGQKITPFSGKLVYSIEICDTSLTKMIPPTQMVIYTNDTLLRIENTTDQLGQQVIIKHLLMNKSYLLIQTPINNYAIHSDHTTEKRDTFPYSFEKKMGSKKIAGMRAKKLLVSHKNFTEPMTVYYLKKYSVKYVNTLENFPGLPVEYYISSVDGTYKYTLKSMETMTPEKDLFGIPSNYKKVSFDEFMDEILQFQQQTEEMPKVHE